MLDTCGRQQDLIPSRVVLQELCHIINLFHKRNGKVAKQSAPPQHDSQSITRFLVLIPSTSEQFVQTS